MHIPVLKKEVIDFLDIKENENFIDCTFGEGGHTTAILEKNKPEGKVLAIDQDILQIEKAKNQKENYKDRLILINDNFSNLKKIVEKENFKNISGILLDLGMSSWHIDESQKGFSFQKDEILDMRYNRAQEISAKEIINSWLESELEKIFKEYGEEDFSKNIAKKICDIRKEREIKTTFQLVEIIKKSVPNFYQHQKIHFATKIFQALRIATNKELESIQRVLPQALDILNKQGRIVVISFHSLEDKIVKNFFKEQEKEGKVTVLTEKPVEAEDLEIRENSRARSAKLRAIIKLT